MKALNKPKGLALEYAPWAFSALFNTPDAHAGCPHGCLYCYVPSATFTKREDFHEGVEPNWARLEGLAADLKRIASGKAKPGTYPGPDDEILLCFSCDPYPMGVDTSITRQALQMIGEAGLKATVLSKGGMGAARDFDLMEKYGFSFGTSLVCQWQNTSAFPLVNNEGADHWEPGAARVTDRYRAIRKARCVGVRTWVSLEPVIYPRETLNIIRELYSVVDHWKVGMLNHQKPPHPIDWAKFLRDVTALFAELGVTDYYIKDELAAYGETEDGG